MSRPEEVLRRDARRQGVKIGTNNTEVVEFPNVLIFFRQQAPTGGTRAQRSTTSVSVPNLRKTVDKVKADGCRMVTREEAVGREVKDDIAGPAAPGGASIAFALGPDDVKVELVEAKAQTIRSRCTMCLLQSEEHRDAGLVREGVRREAGHGGGGIPSGTLPGVALNFSPSMDPVVGTQGRALDHIGFEVKNLEEFCKKLEAQGIKLERPLQVERSASHRLHQGSLGHLHRLTEGLTRRRRDATTDGGA
jgi:catechol 2,3-dioxygenase-like lactoylglutathione lyase family enzyme